MKVSRETAARNRAEVVKAAGRAFRETGIEGSGIAGIMKAAGLTHGGFYASFGSKDALAAEALAEALAGSLTHWNRRLAASKGGAEALAAMAALYLTPAHRDRPGEGCALAALAGDAARGAPQLRAEMGKGVEAIAEALTARGLPRDEALAALAQMVGALSLARAVADPALSTAILEAARRALTVEGAPLHPAAD